MATNVSFLGIGLMGLPMARNLIKAGIDLTVWNRTPDKAQALEAEGAHCAKTLKEAVSGADQVISILADGTVVLSVVQEAIDSGALSSGTVWIDMSSTSVEESKAIKAALEGAGAQYIDAPVSGGVKGAEAGTLAIMAGAEVSTFEQCKALLSHLGNPVRVGENGAGQVAKLANQSMVAAYIAAVSEAVLLCEKHGVGQTAFRAALKGGFADSSVLQLHGQRMAERNFVPGAKATTQLKDMNNILAAARNMGLNLPLAESLQARYTELTQVETRAGLDHSALFLQLLDMNR